MNKYILTVLALCFAFTLTAQIRFDQLPELDSIGNADPLLTQRGGSFMQVKLSTLKTWVNAAVSAATFSDSTYTGETTLFVRYVGTAPTYAKTAAGEWLLTLPAGTVIHGFTISGNNADLTASNTFELTIRSTDGESVYSVYNILAASTGDQYGLSSGVVPRQTAPLAGDILTALPNMSLFGAAGFIIIGKPI